jgi:ribonuclease P protein component
MLPKSQRIPRKLFPLFKSAKYSHTNNLFSLKVVKAQSVQSRFCFSVSKKISKKATDRNSLRRIGYSILRSKIPSIEKGLLLCFYYRKYSKDKNEIGKEISDILKVSNLIKI